MHLHPKSRKQVSSTLVRVHKYTFVGCTLHVESHTILKGPFAASLQESLLHLCPKWQFIAADLESL